MLLSEHIRLVAAFDHRHIFLDPTPDAARSFAERRRMFALPRSSWDDYDRALISEGGGVYARDREIGTGDPQVRAALGLGDDVTELSPRIWSRPCCRRRSTCCGTAVSALRQSGVGVRRVGGRQEQRRGARARGRRPCPRGRGGRQPRCDAVGAHRVRAARGQDQHRRDRQLGRVDCSDHEVNIKILLDAVVSSGELPSTDRDPLLASMTDEVARLVLADNIAQNDHSACPVPARPRCWGAPSSDRHARHPPRARPQARGAAHRGRVRPAAQAGGGLTSPDLATVMAHAKLALKQDLLATELPDSDFFSPLVCPVTSRSRCAIGSARRSAGTRCVARSWPRCWRTRRSTTGASRTRTGSRRTRARRAPTRSAPTPR